MAAPFLALTVPVRLSPDGRWVTYSVANPRRQPVEGALGQDYSIITSTGVTMTNATADVWVSNVMSGEARNLTKGKGASWGGTWSPDGRSLAFFSDRDGAVRVWICDVATSAVRRVSDIIVNPYFGFEQAVWHPDGKQLLVRAVPEGYTLEQVLDRVRPLLTADNTRPNVRVYQWPAPSVDSAPAASTLSALSGDLAMIDVQSGAVRRIVHNVQTNGYWISPGGTDLAYTSRVDDHSSVQQMYNLSVASLVNGTSRVLARGIPQPFGLAVSWSPDGTQLAYTEALGTTALSGKNVPRGDCFVVSLAGGEPRNVSRQAHAPFGTFYTPPLWSPHGESLYLLGGDTLWRASVAGAPLTAVASIPARSMSQIIGRQGTGTPWLPDGSDNLYVRTQHKTTNQAGIARVNLASGEVTQVVEEERNYINGVFGMDVVGRTFVRSMEGIHLPENLWVAQGIDSIERPRRLTHISPQLDGHVYGTSRAIEWQTSDGVSIHGALILPAGYIEGKRYPLVLSVYAGDVASRDVFKFGWTRVGTDLRALLATRGYAVLLPDIPVHPGTPMADIAKAVLPGVSRVVDLGIADPDRVGVMGQSYGGYTTLALITQTHRFKAAVSIAGFSNVVSLYGMLLRGGAAGTSNVENGSIRMLVSPWDNLQRYIDNSPFYRFDQVDAPVLLIHGDADIAVPVQRADESFVALRRLGKTVQYAKYAGEGHGWWGYADSVDGVERTIAWFDKYLKPIPGVAKQ